VEAIRLALRHKADLARMVAAADQGGLELVEGASVGVVWLLSQLWRAISASSPALGSDHFDEDYLYANLDWLAQH
jgi:hypothetical protein